MNRCLLLVIILSTVLCNTRLFGQTDDGNTNLEKVANVNESKSALFPNELDQYRIYTRYCGGLKPLHSKLEDLVEAWGESKSEFSKSNVKIYEKGDWKVYVYLYWDDGATQRHYFGRVKSFDFVPKERLSFEDQLYPSAFNRQLVYSNVNSYDIHDSHGLVYKVNEATGFLNRISYRVPFHNSDWQKYELVPNSCTTSGAI